MNVSGRCNFALLDTSTSMYVCTIMLHSSAHEPASLLQPPAMVSEQCKSVRHACAGYYDTHLVASQDAEASYEVIDGKVLASTQHASTGSDTLAGEQMWSARSDVMRQAVRTA